CYLARPGGRIGYDVAGTGPAVVVGNSMGAGSAVIAAAQRPELVSGLVRAGSFVRNPTVSTAQRILLRAAMARPWAALCWKSYLPKLYAGRRPAALDEARPPDGGGLGRPGSAGAFGLTPRASHAPAEARLAQVTAPALVVMGEQDPDFADPAAEAGWIAQTMRAQVV